MSFFRGEIVKSIARIQPDNLQRVHKEVRRSCFATARRALPSLQRKGSSIHGFTPLSGWVTAVSLKSSKTISAISSPSEARTDSFRRTCHCTHHSQFLEKNDCQENKSVEITSANRPEFTKERSTNRRDPLMTYRPSSRCTAYGWMSG